jgi:hypothetical protein
MLVLKVLGGLAVVWLAFIVLGFVIKGLFVLAIVGIVAFLGTAAYTAIRNRSSSSRQIR